MHKFLFGRRLIFGPDARSLLISILLILVLVVIFCALVVRHLRHEFEAYYAGNAISVLAVALTIWVLALLLVASARDLGIIPRASHPPEEEFYNESSASAEGGGRQTPNSPNNRANIYNRGCLNNLMEVFYTKIKPSRNNLCAFVLETLQRPPMVRNHKPEVDDTGGEKRAKVEDDLEIGRDILKISQCQVRNIL
ncbi:hypothetical protein IFM89_034461 [Coptis chinensis]|uniref:Uncharacterized protein n=1 Tax=Coptis chinensis TaxID=261450 RepID=A0A835MEA0_9MAGN|nr:hypothetical protein IFM89_034461 [Coptis chinensis]